MITIKNVTKKYKTQKEDVIALNDISLTLPSKGLIGLSGENGCGKSTLLNLISTYDIEFEGNIFIDNIDIKSNENLIKKDIISYMMQDDLFVKNLNVEENIKLINSNNELVENQIRSFDLLSKKNKYSYELSGGQKQRVSMITSFLKNYDILLVDEPTCSLNEEMEIEVFKILKEIAKEKLVILVSHNKSLLKENCQMIVYLHDGTLTDVVLNNFDNIVYNENVITFNNHINFKSIDEKQVSDMLDKYDEVIIKRETKNDLFELDYEIKEHKQDNDSFDVNRLKLIIKTMLLTAAKVLIPATLVITILLYLFEFPYNLKNIDKDDFTYSTLINNDENFINVDFNSAVLDKTFNYSELKEIKDNYDIRVDMVKNLSNIFEYEYALSDKINNTIQNMVCSNFKNTIFISGDKPSCFNEFVITDYVADNLIKQKTNINSYDDLINNGIVVQDYNVKISGIIDTDYEKYIKDFDSLNTKDSNNYSTNQSYIYTSIYCSDSSSLKKDIMGFAYVYDDFIFDLKLNAEVQNGCCIINKKMAEIVGYDGSNNFYIKYNNGYILVSSVIDDDSVNSSMYVNESVFDQNIKARLKSFDSINIEITKEIVEILNEFNCEYNSYSGTYVFKTLDTIYILKKVFNAIIFVEIILLIISSIIFIKVYFNKIKNVIIIIRSRGFSNKYIIFPLLIVFGITMLLISLFNIITYISLNAIMNKALSSLFETSILLCYNSIRAVLVSNLIIFVILALCFTLFQLIYNKNRLIDLIKK